MKILLTLCSCHFHHLKHRKQVQNVWKIENLIHCYFDSYSRRLDYCRLGRFPETLSWWFVSRPDRRYTSTIFRNWTIPVADCDVDSILGVETWRRRWPNFEFQFGSFIEFNVFTTTPCFKNTTTTAAAARGASDARRTRIHWIAFFDTFTGQLFFLLR